MLKTQKQARQDRVRAKVKGTEKRPRLSVFRSNQFIYAQIINDEKGSTIVGVHESEVAKKDAAKKLDRASEVGKLLAKKALTKKIVDVVFDRGSYRYHGRVKAVADGAREGGLKF